MPTAPPPNRPSRELEPSKSELAVILPARNEQDVLPACLESLLAQSQPGFELGVTGISSSSTTPPPTAPAPSPRSNRRPMLSPPRPHRPRSPAHRPHPPPQRLQRQDQRLLDRSPVRHRALPAAMAPLHRRRHHPRPNNLSRSLREAEKHHARSSPTPPARSPRLPPAHRHAPHLLRTSQRLPPAKGLRPRQPPRRRQRPVPPHRPRSPTPPSEAIAPSARRSCRRCSPRPQRQARRPHPPLPLRPGDGRRPHVPRHPLLLEGWSKNFVLLFPAPIKLFLFRGSEAFFLRPPAWPCSTHSPSSGPARVLAVLWVRTVFRFYNRVARAHAAVRRRPVLCILGIPPLPLPPRRSHRTA